jgi:hypothetical protein
LHALHVPHGPALQQTPSVQKPLLHSRPAAQPVASGFFGTQLPGAPALPVQ